MTRDEIKNILPHREPMLLVDEAEVLEDGSALGRYTVTGEEFFLKGHFPDNPVVPGVILCEMMGQACSVLLANDPEVGSSTPYFTKLDGVKFRTPVKPGDTFETRCRITRRKGPFIFAEAEGLVDGKPVTGGTFSFALVK